MNLEIEKSKQYIAQEISQLLQMHEEFIGEIDLENFEKAKISKEKMDVYFKILLGELINLKKLFAKNDASLSSADFMLDLTRLKN